MEWTDKVNMVRLGEKARETKNRKEFHDFVLLHIASFDGQALHMMLNLTDIIEHEMILDEPYYRKICPKLLKLVDMAEDFYSQMRLGIIIGTCKRLNFIQIDNEQPLPITGIQSTSSEDKRPGVGGISFEVPVRG